jgi:prophage regulatory protein
MTTASFLRLPEVQSRTGLAKSTIYLRVAQHTFPSPVRLGGERAVGWIASEIDAWVADQINRAREQRKQQLDHAVA